MEKRNWIYGAALIVFGVLALFILNSCCGSCDDLVTKKSPYIENDTSFTGVVTNINIKNIKRAGDMFFSNINDVIIYSDTTNFSIWSDEISFSIGDTVMVSVTKLKRKTWSGKTTKTIIRKIGNNAHSETYWYVENLNHYEIE